MAFQDGIEAPLSSLDGQKRASDPKSNVWVSASAGTGKTKVLTDRVLSLLLSGVSHQKILCLTFTKAAAQEMSERVMATLATWATLSPQALAKRLEDTFVQPVTPADVRRAKALFNTVLESPQGLNIQTLHSFCQSFLQTFPLEASVAPGFRALEENAQKQVLQQALQEVLLQSPSPAVTQALVFLSQTFGAVTFEEKLLNLILESRRPGRVLPDLPERALEQTLGVNPLQDPETLLETLCSPLFLEEHFDKAWPSLSEGGVEDQKRFQSLKAYLTLPRDAPRLGCFEDLAKTFLTQTGEPRTRLITKKLAAQYPLLEDALKLLAPHLQKTRYTLQEHHTARVSLAFITIAKAVLEAYEALKSRQNLLDYDDLIHKTVEVLKDPALSAWVLYKMEGGLDHILLDEAQDTNGPQWEVLTSLTEEFLSGQGAREDPSTLFVVGDVKQSIYSFQGANPALFEQQRQVFCTKARSARASWQDIGLNLSFRSCPAILKAVDQVFQGPARKGVRTLETHSLTHKAFRTKSLGWVEMWPLEKEPRQDLSQGQGGDADQMQALFTQDQAGGETSPLALSASEKLAQKIATTLREWLGAKKILASRGRPLEPGDILILLQRRGPFFRQLHQALKKAGVPVSGEDRLNLQDQLCVQDLVALGRFLLLPEDDFSLACVLKSPLIGLTEEALFQLCYQRPQTLWASLIREGAREGALPSFHAAHTVLSKLLSLVDRLTPYELYMRILNQEGTQEAFLKRLGPQALDPLEEFLESARRYEDQKVPSLQGFLATFAQGSFDLKRDFSGSKHREVRLMTIHGSKGLQAPLVFLPDTVWEPRLRDSFLWQETGPFWNPPQALETPRIARLKAPFLQALQEEYHRLLYVAMTRAEDALIIAGFETQKGSRPSCWYQLILDALQSQASRQEKGPWVFRDEEPKDQKRKDPHLKDKGEDSFRQGPSCPTPWTAAPGSPASLPPPVSLKSSLSSSLSTSQSSALPAWAFKKAPLETSKVESLTPTSFTPATSSLGIEKSWKVERAKARGTLFHTLMEVLPSLAPAERERVIQATLATQDLDEREKSELQETFARLLKAPSLEFLFSGKGLHEVPLRGLLEDQVVTGQIDFVIEDGGELKLIDFKTNKNPPSHVSEVPEAYREQLRTYRKLLAPLYPQKTLTTWILWTASAHLMRLDET